MSKVDIEFLVEISEIYSHIILDNGGEESEFVAICSSSETAALIKGLLNRYYSKFNKKKGTL